MAVAGREIQTELNTFELMATARLSVLSSSASLIAVSKHGFAQVKTKKPGLHVLRNLFHFTGQNLWFYGITVIPLAQLVALEFSSPIWVALLAPLMLGESMTRAKFIGAMIGFIGVLVVARPGFAPLEARSSRRIGRVRRLCHEHAFHQEADAHGHDALRALLDDGEPGGDGLCACGSGRRDDVFAGHDAVDHPRRRCRAFGALLPDFGFTPCAGDDRSADGVRTSSAHRNAGMVIYGEPLELAVFAGAALILAGNLYNIIAQRGCVLPPST
jgi:uncharacterized membrane protein